MTEIVSETPPASGGRAPLWRAGLYAGVGALIANYIVLFLTKPMAPGFMSLSAIPVTFWTVLGAIGATLTYALIRRLSQTPERTFLITAVVVFLVSLAPDIWVWEAKPPAFAGVTLGGICALMAMHLAAAVIITGVLLRTTRPATR